MLNNPWFTGLLGGLLALNLVWTERREPPTPVETPPPPGS
jgi:hypothetical protein